MTQQSSSKDGLPQHILFDDFAYALSLSLQEIQDAKSSVLGKLPVHSDLAVAVSIYEKENEEFLSSFKLAKAIQNACPLPHELISNFQNQDDQERRDRVFATTLTDSTSRNVASTHERSVLHNELACLPNSSEHYVDSIAQSISKPIKIESCNSCLEPSDKGYEVDCKHSYCLECLKALCGAALSDKRLIPVRCCKTPIAKEILLSCFTKKELEKYNRFITEMNQPYDTISSVDLDVIMSAMINDHSWKVCSQCGAIVERRDGCVHMTCICKHEFCYTCLKKWRDCKCELYPQRELETILNERADAQNPQDRNQLENVLRNYYDHQHKWIHHSTKNQICQQCMWRMPSFAMRCSICRETRCRRCTFNA